MTSLERNSSNSLLGGTDTVFLPNNGRTLRVRNCNKLLLTALLVGAVGTAFAGTSCGTNLEYEIVGTTLVLSSPDPTQTAAINTAAFSGDKTITAVALPENVTQVGSQAFMGCTALTRVDLGNVQDISSYAFSGCTALQEIVIPPTVTNIGVEAFRGCTSLRSVLCRPQTAPTLGTSAFFECHSDLRICVPALGAYHNRTNWNSYYEALLTDCFLDEYDEQATVTSKIQTFRSEPRNEIDLFRTLRKAGCFNTLTLPFTVSLSGSPLDGDHVEVYQFVGATVTNDALQLDIAKVTDNTLTAGTPYLIQWDNTGEIMTQLHFSGITWDDDQAAADAGTGQVTFHGFYGKTHIGDNTSGEDHLNLFLGGGNQLYWPSDGNEESAKMLGFRAWFEIATGASLAPVRRGMPAALRIVSAPTDVESPANNTSPAIRKELRNGQLVIIRNGETFSVNGQKL